MFQDLHAVESVPVDALEDARVKACEARITCEYDLATLEADDDERDADVGQIAEDVWYEDAYLEGGCDGEGAYGQADGTGGPGGDQSFFFFFHLL